ncbi:hypothetical protein ACLESD_37125, partial [Pyxidicoccus sp. 3LFB2]
SRVRACWTASRTWRSRAGVCLARPRLYDRQALRLRPEELAGSVAELVERTVRLTRDLPARGSRPYAGGAGDAVSLIECALLSA